ncbi:MAG: helix-turn-helix domain-containing protein [Candidatus Desantisbacteria bacterium]
MKEKDIVMKVKEAKRLRVIEESIEKQLTQRKAANILGLSGRQVRRIVKRVQREGPIGIIHLQETDH